MRPVTSHHPVSSPDAHHDPLSNAMFGFWVFLMSDLILFATIFVTYVVLYTGTAGGPTARDIFNLPFVLGETLILLTSSFTVAVALVPVLKNNKNQVLFWFALTFFLGLAFMAMELSEFRHLISEGNTWQKSAFLSSYFTLLGIHGLHMTGGLLFMILFNLQLWRRGLTPVMIMRLECLKLYWLFLTFIWMICYSFVYLLGV